MENLLFLGVPILKHIRVNLFLNFDDVNFVVCFLAHVVVFHKEY